MTRIIAMNGIKPGVPQHEWADRSANIGPRRHIPFSSLTNGEMQLHLLDRQIEVLKGYSPEYKNYYSKLQQDIRNALHAGLHRNGKPYAASIASVNPALGKQVRAAIGNTHAAQGKRRLLPRNGKNIAAIGDPNQQIIPLRDCSEFVSVVDDGYGNYQEFQLPGYNDCMAQAAFEVKFNEHIWNGAHHLLYEYLDPRIHINTPFPDGERVSGYSAGIVGSKTTLHRLAMSQTARVAEFERTLLKQWYATAIMERNTGVGLPPFDASKTITQLKWGMPISKTNPKYNVKGVKIAGVGVEPVSTTVALVIAITKLVGALVAAMGAASALIAAIKGRYGADMRQGLLKDIGDVEFSSDTLDWDGDGIPNSQDSTPGIDPNLIVIGAAAAGALLLLNDK